MKTFIEKQQELAREMWTYNSTGLTTIEFIEKITAQVITNTGEELMRLAVREEVPIPEAKRDWGECDAIRAVSHSRAISTMQEHIRNVTGVEK